METQKIENLLNISLKATEEEREKSINLETGYDRDTKSWELIVKYNGDIAAIAQKYPGVSVYELINEYAILNVPERLIDIIAAETVIEYIEKPKNLYFNLEQEKAASCITPLQSGAPNSYQLFGENIITAIIDTGINITDSDFRNADGTTRIINIWDQTTGNEYSREQINEALQLSSEAERRQLVSVVDVIGHGSSVARIACGNTGVASKSSIIIVKLGLQQANSFPRTTQIMTAIDYVVRKAIEYSMPIAINLSIGNNYGDHSGTSLLETYLDDISNYWKSSICIGSGNEGMGSTHTSGYVKDYEEYEVEMAISDYETTINLQIWKQYADEMDIELIAPTGKVIGPIKERNVLNRFYVNGTEILAYYGDPSPYNMMQEIYFDFIPSADYILSGIWTIRIIPGNIVNGRFDMWLPSIASINNGTGFLDADSSITATIPSTASKVISVGAYNSYNNSYASFSGRGYVANYGSAIMSKPDIVAPGVNIVLETPMGLTTVTGTSFATPFVTGSAALLMEWGIVRGNDAYLYGEKVRAYLIKGAKQLPGMESPNPLTGWGALCVKDSLPL